MATSGAHRATEVAGLNDMPLYGFVCQVCGRRFELRQTLDGLPVAVCPKGHRDVRRVLEPVPIHFRGSGFYTTDSKKRTNGRTH